MAERIKVLTYHVEYDLFEKDVLIAAYADSIIKASEGLVYIP